MKTKIPTPGPAGNPTPVSPTTAFSLVRDDCRRYLLEYCARTTASVTLTDAIDAIAIQDGDRSASHRDRIEIELYHMHIPMCVDTGVLSYDADRQLLRAQPRLGDLEPYFSCARASPVGRNLE